MPEAVRSLLRRIIGRGPAPPLFRVVKRSAESWPAAAVMEAVTPGMLRRPPRYVLEIETGVAGMRGELAGQVRRTSFRHEWVEKDASEVLAGVSSPRLGGMLLYELVRLCRPDWIVELGSAFGISALYMTEALSRNGSGRLDGIEYERWRAELASRFLETRRPGKAVIHHGGIEDILPRLTAGGGSRPAFAFVDAVHKYDECMGYHGLLAECLADGATVVWDDVNFSEEMGTFWASLVNEAVITDAVLCQGRWGIVRYGSCCHGRSDRDAIRRCRLPLREERGPSGGGERR